MSSIKLTIIKVCTVVIILCGMSLVGLKVQEGSQYKDEAKQSVSSVLPGVEAGRKTEGEKVYQNCVACHGEKGEGMANIFPPLSNSEAVLAESPEYTIRVILFGIEGPIEVAGVKYNNPAGVSWEAMGNAKIAAVASMIRQNADWHDGRTASPVTPEQVAEIRKDKKDNAFRLQLRNQIVTPTAK